jgi:hypothetical protein
MKNKLVLTFGILMVFGLVLAGCPNDDTTNNGDGDDVFKGTWVSTEIKIVAADGIFTQYLIANNKNMIRGSYTVSGNTVNLKITGVNTEMFGAGADNWVSYADLTDQAKENVGSENQQISISGNKFTSNAPNEMEFTKQYKYGTPPLHITGLYMLRAQ